jgi:riboflavin kinase/FMN adenylyltransferase
LPQAAGKCEKASVPSETSQSQRAVCAIGNFDGVHRGHLSVLARAAREANEEGLRAVALTFDPPPGLVVGRGHVELLTPTERKVRIIEGSVPGLRVVVKTFDRAFSQLLPEEFASSVLVGEIGAARVVIGQNFRFGRGRAGDLEVLKRLGDQLGFVAEAAEVMGDERGNWSSSRVRAAIARGDWEDVDRVLGRPHALTGRVVEGDRRGRTIGFATANLDAIAEMMPPNGVYAVKVDRVLESGDEIPLASGVANLGVRPTVGAGRSVEVHLLDWSGDLYGQRLRMHLWRYLREERKFDSVDALVAQIAEDAKRAREILG